jgi:hypothetical protein
LCLFDAEGSCANAVKDAQRTKTGPDTKQTLSLIWGSVDLPGRAGEAETWYRQLLEQHGATTALIQRADKQQYSLDELIAGITDENRHAETDWGNAEGREA